MTRTTLDPNPSKRLHLDVQGMLQGVGFRPFVYRLATELELGGWIRNNVQGAEIEVEGIEGNLNTFLSRLECDRPPQTVLSKLEPHWLNPCGYHEFKIQPSSQDKGVISAWILPDLATCPECLAEVFDPNNRRYYYPFTNCTHCGPRYSILKTLPYDRPNTSMVDFHLCPACYQEYESPQDRRFHAQPNACPDCGPQLELRDSHGTLLFEGGDTTQLIQQVANHIRQGDIVALKGIGGFQLMVDARNEAAVQRLRDRKHRPTKPFALMYPNLELLKRDCEISNREQEALTSTAAPIVLLQLRQQPDTILATGIAPHQARIGAMLPYSPLHHILLRELGFPVVATSGNRSQEPIAIDNAEALEKLGEIADIFLMHNRPIVRPVDDSVVQVIDDELMILRRARGYAPAPIAVAQAKELPPLLSVGGHLKNTVALSLDNQVFMSQHLGDLDEANTFSHFHETVSQLLDLYSIHAAAIACDPHPDYTSTQVAQMLSERMEVPLIYIQHHYAHVLAGIIDNQLKSPVLGIAWDGTGYGLDNTVWGGEFLSVSDRCGFVRMAHLKTFSLPGGDRAALEPYRSALGLMYEVMEDKAFQVEFPGKQMLSQSDLKLLQSALDNNVNTVRTSSVGRLFDAIASLIGVCQISTFEGEAAMRLEAAIGETQTTDGYSYELTQEPSGALSLNWHPMLMEILAERDSAPVGLIAAKFHNTLIEAIAAIAHEIGFSQVLLTGGCFQNRYLLEGAIQKLRAEGFFPYWHHQIPPNDGGLAMGQILGAAWRLEQAKGEFTCA